MQVKIGDKTYNVEGVITLSEEKIPVVEPNPVVEPEPIPVVEPDPIIEPEPEPEPIIDPIVAELIPKISILPQINVEVGEEVFFSAAKSIFPDMSIMGKCKYEWDFGDGYYHRYDPVNLTITRQSVAVTHFYMKPGDYKVKLKSTLWESFDESGVPSAVEAMATGTATVKIGEVILIAEPGLHYSAGMTGKIMAVGSTDGYDHILYCTITSYDTATGKLVVNSYDTYRGGGTYSSWKLSFQTLPLAIEEATVAIHVTGEAPMAGFEIQRASFHNRLAQYLYVQIPAAYRRNQTTLRVTLEGAGNSTVLFSKRNLAGEEKVFLDHKPLVQGDYVVIAELLDAEGVRIPGGLWRDKFSKKYDGIPRVGIDENNAFRVNGELFFPMAPYMIGISEYQTYISQAGINAVNTEGYTPKHTPVSWSAYLDQVNEFGLMAIGPGRGDYEVSASPNRWKFNHNPDRMAEYIRLGKDKPAMFAWIWQDEPNLGGRTEKVYPPTLAAWAYTCHYNDPHHPAYNLYLGNDWSKYYGEDFREYDYLGSAPLFGGKKWMQDVLSFDAYPIASRKHNSLNMVDMGPYAAYLDLMERFKDFNKSLTPVIPALQPCKGAADKTWEPVTEEQVYMETWINVIHGAKGIVWFNYFDMANSGRWSAMKKFADQMNVLAPVVLQQEPERTITSDATVALNRVDTMIREKDGIIYVFAARVTEPDPIPEVKYQGVEPEIITVNFAISDILDDKFAEVVDEERSVSLSNGQFTDTFTKNAVHIYKVGMRSIIENNQEE